MQWRTNACSRPTWGSPPPVISEQYPIMIRRVSCQSSTHGLRVWPPEPPPASNPTTGKWSSRWPPPGRGPSRGSSGVGPAITDDTRPVMDPGHVAARPAKRLAASDTHFPTRVVSVRFRRLSLEINYYSPATVIAEILSYSTLYIRPTVMYGGRIVPTSNPKTKRQVQFQIRWIYEYDESN